MGSLSASAQTNSWTGQATGAWEDLTWSLGARPNISQSAIMVTNYGQKAIIVGPNTVNNFPSTLTVSNLTLGGTSLSTNTLLLNFTGTAHPLHVMDSLNMLSNSVLLNLNGMFALDGNNPTTSVDGVINQSGGSNVFPGFVRIGVYSDGFYNLTNGTVVCGSTILGDVGSYSQASTFQQFGGLAQFGDLNISGTYLLSNGTASASYVYMGGEGSGDFQQFAGDVVVTNSIAISYNYNSASLSRASWITHNGSVTAAGIGVGPADGSFTQIGGTVHVGEVGVTALVDYDYGYPQEGGYYMSGGLLQANGVSRDSAGIFNQSGGTIMVTGDVDGGISQTGGLLYCSNITYADRFFNTFDQSNATMIVSNTFVLAPLGTATFNFHSGLLQCSNLVVGPGAFNYFGGQIINAGTVVMNGGTFSCSVTNQQFGGLTLSNASHFQLATNPCVITFKDSSANQWNSTATLWIDGWQGATNGGGATRIYVGNSAHGLTSAQLSQIIFNNSQYARQLPSGEIVPTDRPTMAVSVQSPNFVITWPTAIPYSFHLQSATNVLGPYFDVPNQSSPFTIAPLAPRQFFRLH